MVLLALLVVLAGMTVFNAGGSTPGTGPGNVIQAPAPARNTAKLAIKRVYPMVIVAGTGFKSGEVVRLSGVSTRQLRASARGTFTVRFRAGDPCSGFSVIAVGNKGSRTAVNYSQLSCAAP